MEEGEGYKYLGVLMEDAGGMLLDQIKDKIGKEYLRRVENVARWK